jgi:hypothetical protein
MKFGIRDRVELECLELQGRFAVEPSVYADEKIFSAKLEPMASLIEKGFRVLIQLGREILYDLGKGSGSHVFLELHVEPEFSELLADQSCVVQRVVQWGGMCISGIGNNECEALQASGVTIQRRRNAYRD